jgi:proteasome lid subunit RPN8/RPN11
MTRMGKNGAAVTISDEARRSIANCAVHALPEECCGVLVGRIGDSTDIVAAWELPNRLAHGRTRRFELAPEDLYQQMVRARAIALDVVGFFHSHPVGEAQPSLRDIRDASVWPGYVNAIYACASREADRLRVYRTELMGWQEISIKG